MLRTEAARTVAKDWNMAMKDTVAGLLLSGLRRPAADASAD